MHLFENWPVIILVLHTLNFPNGFFFFLHVLTKCDCSGNSTRLSPKEGNCKQAKDFWNSNTIVLIIKVLRIKEKQTMGGICCKMCLNCRPINCYPLGSIWTLEQNFRKVQMLEKVIRCRVHIFPKYVPHK